MFQQYITTTNDRNRSAHRCSAKTLAMVITKLDETPGHDLAQLQHMKEMFVLLFEYPHTEIGSKTVAEQDLEIENCWSYDFFRRHQADIWKMDRILARH